jgi:C4-dicarboxylate transporter, DctQ subunit
MKTVDHFKRVFDAVVDVLAVFAGVILILIIICVSLDVVLRYFFKSPLLWVDELAEYGLLYITFTGTAWLLRQDGHVVVDLIDALVSPKTRSRLNVFSSIVGAVVCSVLTYFGVAVTWSLFARRIYNPTMLEIPRGVLVAVIPVGTFLLSIQFLRRLLASLRDSGRR